MQKLKLEIEALDVESFHLGDETDAEGTVHAQSVHDGEYGPSEVSGCTCTTAGTAFFSEGCEFTVGFKTC